MSLKMNDIARRSTNSEEENAKYLPFNIQWLDSSYQHTFLPDSPWQKVKICFNSVEGSSEFECW